MGICGCCWKADDSLKLESAFYFRDGVAIAELDSGEVLINREGKPVATGYKIVDLVTEGAYQPRLAA
jgi:hypothetical protein